MPIWVAFFRKMDGWNRLVCHNIMLYDGKCGILRGRMTDIMRNVLRNTRYDRSEWQWGTGAPCLRNQQCVCENSQWCEVSALKLNPETKTKVVCLYGSMTNKVVQVKKCRKVTFVCVLVFTHFSVFCLFWFWFKDYKTSSGIIVKLKVIKYFPNVIIIFKKKKNA